MALAAFTITFLTIAGEYNQKKHMLLITMGQQADQRVLLVYAEYCIPYSFRVYIITTVTICVYVQSTNPKCMQYPLCSELLSARLVWLIVQGTE